MKMKELLKRLVEKEAMFKRELAVRQKYCKSTALVDACARPTHRVMESESRWGKFTGRRLCTVCQQAD